MSNNTFNFIVLEGTDNVGKTTAVRYINDYYHSLGYEVINYRLPGGTPVGEIIRERIWKDNISHGSPPPAMRCKRLAQ